MSVNSIKRQWPDLGIRQRLLLSGEKILSQQGLSDAKIRQFTVEAGSANISAIHYHFGTVDAFLEIVCALRQPRISALYRACRQQVADYFGQRSQLPLQAEVYCVVAPQLALVAETWPSCFSCSLMDVLNADGYHQGIFARYRDWGGALSPGYEFMQSHLATLLGEQEAAERLLLMQAMLSGSVREIEGELRRFRERPTKLEVADMCRELTESVSAALLQDFYQSSARNFYDLFDHLPIRPGHPLTGTEADPLTQER